MATEQDRPPATEAGAQSTPPSKPAAAPKLGELAWLWRQASLTAFPCPLAMKLGVKPDSAESTSPEHQAEEQKALSALGACDHEQLRDVLATYETLHSEEEERKKGVDARLSTVVSMSSIIAAITFGFFSAALEKGYAAKMGWMGVVATVVFLYSVLQMVLSVSWAVHGLRSRDFVEMTAPEFLPKTGESQDARLRRTIGNYSEALNSHDVRIGEKIVCLELAHRGVLNFLGALLFLASFLAIAGWIDARGERSQTDALQSAVKGPNATESPRGAKGERGPPGEPGPRGPEGKRGPPGPAGTPCLPDDNYISPPATTTPPHH